MATHVCPWWFAYTFDNPARRLFHDPAKMFGPYVEPGSNVLDLGCGMGYFSIGMARLVGDSGRVISVDLQLEMLDILGKRAAKAGVDKRIDRRLAQKNSIAFADLAERIDFALAFWMVHEVPDIKAFISQIHGMLSPGARFLFAEPKFHVSDDQFEASLATAREVGFKNEDRPKISFSRAAVLTKD